MNRLHALLLALLLGASAVAATYAVLKTTALGTNAKATTVGISESRLAARNARLDKVEAALRHALRKKPPALPKRPKRIAPQSHVVHVASSTPPAQSVATTPATVLASTSSSGSSSASGSTSDDGSGTNEPEPEPEGGDDGP
jgi:hypothetical protein